MSRMSRILLWVEQRMSIYLKRRGWVVFYLEERSRHCADGTCWLTLYQSEEKRDREKLS